MKESWQFGLFTPGVGRRRIGTIAKLGLMRTVGIADKQ
jgi:hypothetical protein